MKNHTKRYAYLWVFLFLFFDKNEAMAEHIYGGNLYMMQIDRDAGHFKIVLNMFVDFIVMPSSEDPYLKKTPVTIRIFRKRDNTQVEEISMPFEAFQDLVYDNSACSQIRNFKTREYRYAKEVILNLDSYTDIDGYYIAWEKCCRNAAINNIYNPGASGMTLYLEFPNLKQNGQAINYSSPIFNQFNGDYICNNKPFSYNVGATDNDPLNELKFSLVTPFSSHNTINSASDKAQPGPYPLVQWLPGYSSSIGIKGSSPLSIDSKTGIVSVTAGEIGVFVFSVQCEQFRNGKRIGLVRHDFQLPVIDCATNIPETPIVTWQGNKAKTFPICNGVSIILETDDRTSNWNFQWKKNGINIPSATASTLTVTEKGQYTVIKSFKNICATNSQSEIVDVKEPADIKIEASKIHICENESSTLIANVEPSSTYEWFLDGVSQGVDVLITTNKAGIYSLRSHRIGSSCIKETAQEITVSPIPLIHLYNTTDYTFCEGDSVKLGVNSNIAYTYQWFINDIPIMNKGNESDFFGKKMGIYNVRVTDNSTLCENKSANIGIHTLSLPIISFDSIAPVCPILQPIVSLKGSPSNGVFKWNDTPITYFDAASAGQGKHVVKFSYSDGQCTARQNRIIEVKSSSCVDDRPLANKLLFPTVFTPNNDGINDKWEVENISQYAEAQLWIYDRWGSVIYYEKGNKLSWDGINNNGSILHGTYIFRILVTPNSKDEYSGVITILN